MLEMDWNPGTRQLRVFAAAGLVILAIILLVLWTGGGVSRQAAVLLGIPAVGAVYGLIFPQSLRFVYVLSATVTAPIGWVVSNIILAILFYAVLTPVALAMRAVGRDPLSLRKGKDEPSCWSKKSQPSGIEDYVRQS